MSSFNPYSFLLLLLALFAMGYGANAQSVSSSRLNDIKVSFLKDTVDQSGSSLAFNRVTITNSSSQKKVVTIELDLPEDWSSPFGTSKIYELAPNAVLDLPIRTAASNGTLSNRVYPVTVKVKSPGSPVILATYIARVLANSKWNAMLVTPEVQLDRSSRETYFKVRIVNSGNVDEDLSVDFRTGLELTIPKKNNRVVVKARMDTTVMVGIITDPRYLNSFKPQDIFVAVESNGKTEKLLIQKVFSSSSVFRANESRWYNVPMFVELVGQNFTVPGQQRFYMNSAGGISLEKTRSITYTFRSDDYDSQEDGDGVSNRNVKVNYVSKSWKVSVGDLNEFGTFPMEGLGARVGHTTSGGYSVDLLGVNSRLGNARQFSLSQNLPLGKKSGLSNSTFMNLDRGTHTNSYSTLSEFNTEIGRSRILVSGGYGAECLKPQGAEVNRDGFAGGFNYYYNSPRFIARSINNYTSGNFSGLERGVKRTSSEVRLLMKKYFAGAIADYNSRSTSLVDSSRLISLFAGRTSEIGLRAGFQGGSNNITLTASRMEQLQDSATNVPFQSNKIGLNAGMQLFSKLNISLTANYINSFSKPGFFDGNVQAFNAFGSIQTNNLGVSFRVDRGPFYYSSLLDYVVTGASPDRFQFAPFVEKSFFKSVLTSRVEVNYMNDVANQAKDVAARVDLNIDLKKRGLSVRFYGSHNFTDPLSTDYLNLSLRKTFNMPLLGLRKFNSLEVVLFKDQNNNNVFDRGDQAIPGASLKILGQSFTTNTSGEAVYKNVSDGEYTLELKQDDNVKGWIAKNGFRQQIKLDRSQTWYIPFKESRYLSGRINVVKDSYSKLTFNAASIRITAVNSKGEVFTTLTNGEGAFFMNLPGDTYLLQINNNVFTEDFRVLEDSFSIDLSEGNKEDIVFEVREKRRAINIRKAGG